MGAGYPCQQPRNVSTLPRLRPAAASAQSRTRDADAQSRSARVRWRQFRRPGAMQRVRSGLSRRVGGCVIMILIGAIFAYGWHGDDRRARRMAEAVMAHRAIDKPADAHMFVRPDYEQRCSDRFGQSDSGWMELNTVTIASRRAVSIAEAFIGTAMPPIPSCMLKSGDMSTACTARRLCPDALACSAAQTRAARADGDTSKPTRECDRECEWLPNPAAPVYQSGDRTLSLRR
jgi:hypothetical protein